jgi:dUTP pyrophosphatase
MSESETTLFFTKLSVSARVPEKKSSGAAGYDIYSLHGGTILPSKQDLVPTGIAMVLPQGCYGRIAPRSGLSLRGIHVGAGVIDADYRGEIKVILYNFSDTPFHFHPGERIAQLILEKIYTDETCVVISKETFEKEHTNTSRGSGGFGSTGSS